jgi:hypothetical protein
VLQSLELRTRQAVDDEVHHGEFLYRLLSRMVAKPCFWVKKCSSMPSLGATPLGARREGCRCAAPSARSSPTRCGGSRGMGCVLVALYDFLYELLGRSLVRQQAWMTSQWARAPMMVADPPEDIRRCGPFESQPGQTRAGI